MSFLSGYRGDFHQTKTSCHLMALIRRFPETFVVSSSSTIRMDDYPALPSSTNKQTRVLMSRYPLAECATLWEQINEPDSSSISIDDYCLVLPVSYDYSKVEIRHYQRVFSENGPWPSSSACLKIGATCRIIEEEIEIASEWMPLKTVDGEIVYSLSVPNSDQKGFIESLRKIDTTRHLKTATSKVTEEFVPFRSDKNVCVEQRYRDKEKNLMFSWSGFGTQESNDESVGLLLHDEPRQNRFIFFPSFPPVIKSKVPSYLLRSSVVRSLNDEPGQPTGSDAEHQPASVSGSHSNSANFPTASFDLVDFPFNPSTLFPDISLSDGENPNSEQLRHSFVADTTPSPSSSIPPVRHSLTERVVPPKVISDGQGISEKSNGNGDMSSIIVRTIISFQASELPHRNNIFTTVESSHLPSLPLETSRFQNSNQSRGADVQRSNDPEETPEEESNSFSLELMELFSTRNEQKRILAGNLYARKRAFSGNSSKYFVYLRPELEEKFFNSKVASNFEHFRAPFPSLGRILFINVRITKEIFAAYRFMFSRTASVTWVPLSSNFSSRTYIMSINLPDELHRDIENFIVNKFKAIIAS